MQQRATTITGPPAPRSRGEESVEWCVCVVHLLSLQVDKITRQIAYPDFVLNKEQLDQFYALVSHVVVMWLTCDRQKTCNNHIHVTNMLRFLFYWIYIHIIKVHFVHLWFRKSTILSYISDTSLFKFIFTLHTEWVTPLYNDGVKHDHNLSFSPKSFFFPLYLSPSPHCDITSWILVLQMATFKMFGQRLISTSGTTWSNLGGPLIRQGVLLWQPWWLLPVTFHATNFGLLLVLVLS